MTSDNCVAFAFIKDWSLVLLLGNIVHDCTCCTSTKHFQNCFCFPHQQDPLLSLHILFFQIWRNSCQTQSFGHLWWFDIIQLSLSIQIIKWSFPNSRCFAFISLIKLVFFWVLFNRQLFYICIKASSSVTSSPRKWHHFGATALLSISVSVMDLMNSVMVFVYR